MRYSELAGLQALLIDDMLFCGEGEPYRLVIAY